MGIRKPSVSVTEARRLAETRQAGLDLATARAAPPAPDALSPKPGPLPDPASDPTSDGADAAGKDDGAPQGAGSGRPGISGHTPERKAPERKRPDRPAPETPSGAAPGGRPLFDPLAAQREAKIQVFLSAPLPADGVSRSFDLLTRTYPPARALQLILRRALDLYEPRLEDGTFAAAPADYPVAGQSVSGQSTEATAGGSAEGEGDLVQTSRMMAKRVVSIARAHFDPLGFESNRAFGRMLATAALAAFFEAERTGRR